MMEEGVECGCVERICGVGEVRSGCKGMVILWMEVDGRVYRFYVGIDR